MARRILAVSARAFVSRRKGCTSTGGNTWEDIANILEKDGGNPVTIFYPCHDEKSATFPLTSTQRATLAKSCNWESIIIEPRDSELHTFHFFMPSGEEVSFCGHAAIGASEFIANRSSFVDSKSLITKVGTDVIAVPFLTADHMHFHSVVCGNEVELTMNVYHEEYDCNEIHNSTSLDQILNELGLTSQDVLVDGNLPVYINSSVARHKTLIPIKSVAHMNAATAPKDATKFRDLCDAIDSTGIYLYAQCKDSSNFECRQFPRASGYAEDPATGIAAGALAASLYKRNDRRDCYSVNQGTAMGRPSNIRVKIGNCNDGKVKLSYTGLVVFDSITQLDEP